MELKTVTSELALKTKLHKHSVMQGDFFILSSEKGYTPTQIKDVMQVMECWDNVMTVKCKGGCMTKEYDHFEKVTDLTGFQSVNRYEGEMEDRRSYRPA